MNSLRTVRLASFRLILWSAAWGNAVVANAQSSGSACTREGLKGIVVAFLYFAKSLPDFHMFKMRNGKVELIQSVIGAASPSTGWASEEVLKN
jgi:hypothetical protein